MRRAIFIFSSLVLIASWAACGGSSDFGTGTIAIIEVQVDGSVVPVDLGEDPTEEFETPRYSFQAIKQDTAEKEVVISNQGTRPITISGIDWAQKNDYIELDWHGAVDTFPYEIGIGEELVFDVVYSPPIGQPLDDFRDSILVVESNAVAEDGATLVPEISMIFGVPTFMADPKVTPTNYTFSNATITTPETQEFTIYNDCEDATDSFTVTDIYLELATNEFRIVNDDLILPAEVAQPNPDPNLCLSLPTSDTVKFSVIYQPIDQGDDSNVIRIEIDGMDQPLRITIDSDTVFGSWGLSFSHSQKFDFSTEGMTGATRSVLLSSDGPGPITVAKPGPTVDPEEAADVFEVKAFLPATSADSEDEEIESDGWPRALTMGKTLRVDVTYAPPVDGSDPPNAQLVIPIETPDQEDIVLDIFAGEPKPKLELAPSTKSVVISPDTTTTTMGTRHVALYNRGNGDLVITGFEIEGPFSLEPELFTLNAPPSLPHTIAPGGISLLEVAWDSFALDDAEGESETLLITYRTSPSTCFSDENCVGTDSCVDGMCQGVACTTDDECGTFQPCDGGTCQPVIEESMLLFLKDVQGMTPPTAVIEFSDAEVVPVASEPVFLSAMSSSAGTYKVSDGSYVWYLTAKPATSQAHINEENGAVVSFLPDVAGSYTVELLLNATQGSDFLISEAASFTFDVGEAASEDTTP